jgi:hypothetical protein
MFGQKVNGNVTSPVHHFHTINKTIFQWIQLLLTYITLFPSAPEYPHEFTKTLNEFSSKITLRELKEVPSINLSKHLRHLA